MKLLEINGIEITISIGYKLIPIHGSICNLFLSIIVIIILLVKEFVMTALLYYSISSNLTEDEIIEIESQVANNRETICTFVIIIGLASRFWFGNLESAEAIGLPIPLALPSAPLERVQPSYQHDSKVQFAKVIPRKNDLVAYRSSREIVFLMYLTDPKISSNEQILGVVKRLRGGSWAVGVGILGIIILLFAHSNG